MFSTILSLIFGSSQCCVDPETQRWLEFRMQWILKNLAALKPLDQPVVTLSREFFPDPYYGDWDSAVQIFPHIARLMQLDPDRFQLLPLLDMYQFTDQISHDAAATYHEQDGNYYVGLASKTIANPASCVAALAHELAHCHLLGTGLMTVDEPDHEFVTDLLTIMMGFGVIASDANLQSGCTSCGSHDTSHQKSQGYLNYLAIGHSLAMIATLRHEPHPAWMRQVRLDVRSAMKQSLRWLARQDSHLLDRMQSSLRKTDAPFVPAALLPGGLYQSTEPNRSASFDGDYDDPYDEEAMSLHDGDCGCGSSCSTGQCDTGQCDTDHCNTEHTGSHCSGGCCGSNSSDDVRDFESLADEHFTHATFLFQDGELREALDEINRAIELCDTDAEFFKLRSQIYLAGDELELAHEDAVRAVQFDRTDIESALVLGHILLKKNEPARARDLFIDVIARYDKHDDPSILMIRAYYWHGESLLALGQPHEALEQFNAGIRFCNEGLLKSQHAPTAPPELYEARAIVFEALNQRDAAEQDREQARQLREMRA